MRTDEGQRFLLVTQALSFGLTQYDVEELKEHCDNRCRVQCLLTNSKQDPLVLLWRYKLTEWTQRWIQLLITCAIMQSHKQRLRGCTRGLGPWIVAER